MQGRSVHIDLPALAFDAGTCAKGLWIVLLHATRIPPHVGLLINGSYHSLTIKGPELNVTPEALLKTIAKKEIEAVFIKVARHPVFSASYQNEVFAEIVKKEEAVKQNARTCLFPIKLFFREFYALPLVEEELLFDFATRLHGNKFLDHFSTCNFTAAENGLALPLYSAEELNDRIKHERLPFYKD